MHFREMTRARNAPYITVPNAPILLTPNELPLGPLHGSGAPVRAKKQARIDDGPNGREYQFTFECRKGDRFAQTDYPVQLKLLNTQDGLFYAFSVPSVTTILDKVIETPELDAWRDAVGHQTADRIAAESAEQGQLVHSLSEEYLKTGTVDVEGELAKSATPQAWNLFHLIRQELSTLDVTHHLEQSLVSLEYGFAGTVDVICTRNGKKAILDIKTYRKKRTREQLEKAFVQMALYALASEVNLYGFTAEDLVVVYANPEHGLQVETAPYSEYRAKAIEHMKQFHASYTMQPVPLESSSWSFATP